VIEYFYHYEKYSITSVNSTYKGFSGNDLLGGKQGMHYDLLARFINQSSDWSNAKRQLEIFQYSSELFKELFQVDSGFFMYKKRIPLEISQRLTIYEPWGDFKDSIECLQSCLDTNIPSLESLPETCFGRWLDVKDFPFEIKLPQIQQLGIWKLCSHGKRVGGMVLARTQHQTLEDENVLSVCSNQISLILDMHLAWQMADEMSRYDSLTGVLNRRGVFDLLETIISNADRSESMLAIGLIDVDNFKQINDNYGHPAGDGILIQIARTLKNNIRSGDLVGRVGGDEFVLIMQIKNQETQSLEQRIDKLFPQSDGFTVSVGLAIWNIDGNDWDACYKVADQRLYRMKFDKKVNL
jgi:diguanylate cyclase (GGDEF)-like protein